MKIKIVEINASLNQRPGNQWRLQKLTRIFEIRVNFMKRY